MTTVKLGIDVFSETTARFAGQRLGLLCHAASVASDLRHLTQICVDAGLRVSRCFGPEHGIWADAQDMIPVGALQREPVTGAPTRSLYGADLDSLRPSLDDLRELDTLIIDLQDVGARYYTYVYTAALAMEAAAKVGLPVVILDRPNPIGGRIEGGLTGADWLSFVGLWPLPTRHGLTIGELCSLLNAREGFGCELEVIELRGWRRASYHDQTGLPWVQPSPNMPTVDTAVVYPGMCLIEGTNLSEGRGTTRPFELIGADFIDPFALASELSRRPLGGVSFRPVFYRPTFHKFGGQSIGGVAVHVTDRDAFEPLRCTMHLLHAVRGLFGDAMKWRDEVYEFVDDRLAIDLLFGGDTARRVIDDGGDIDALWHAWQTEAARFGAVRSTYERYP